MYRYTVKEISDTEFWVCYPHQTTSPHSIHRTRKEAEEIAAKRNEKYGL